MTGPEGPVIHDSITIQGVRGEVSIMTGPEGPVIPDWHNFGTGGRDRFQS